MYIKIIGEDTKYNVSFAPFTTQHGYKAVRFSGDEIPSTDKGFMAYDDDDTEICDLSGYKYEYRQNEYSVEEDIIVMPSGNNTPLEPSYIDRRLSSMSRQISNITPFTESKLVGIQDKECVFNDVYKDGTITANVKKDNGEYVPCTIERADNLVRISFDELDTTATVTIQIQ